MSKTTTPKFRNPEATEITGEKIGFSFGENWKKYILKVDEEIIASAQKDFQRVSGLDSLKGMTFLDLGCGSGMNSLIAHRMNADNIISIDFDPNSVEATKYLRSEYGADDHWDVRQGSVLDPEFLSGLGKHEFVLSWGVLHHTGDMWRAIDNVKSLVKDNGFFFISLYHHNRYAHHWLKIKRFYNRSPSLIKKTMTLGLGSYGMMRAMLHFKSPFSVFKNRRRGMDYWRDIEDWLGGLPYEYCKPGEVVERLAPEGFMLQNLTTTYGHGCNEFVFRYFPDKASNAQTQN